MYYKYDIHHRVYYHNERENNQKKGTLKNEKRS